MKEIFEKNKKSIKFKMSKKFEIMGWISTLGLHIDPSLQKVDLNCTTWSQYKNMNRRWKYEYWQNEALDMALQGVSQALTWYKESGQD